MHLTVIFLLNEKAKRTSALPLPRYLGVKEEKKLACLLFDLLLTAWFFTREEFVMSHRQESCKRYLGS